MLARGIDARRLIKLVEKHADLRSLEERHRISRIGGGNPIERVSSILKTPDGEIERTKLEIMAKCRTLRFAHLFQRIDGHGSLSGRHRELTELHELGR